MSLRILKASAGSGKTYSLTETYIRFCLYPNFNLDFRNILAITFTNKASDEMKARIIALLSTLSKDPLSYSGIEALQHDLNLSIDQIQDRCSRILYQVLKEFDQFTITTIDSFFTRLYGSMSLDLFGDVPGEISLEVDKALDYAADQVLAECQVDEELQKIVLDKLSENIRRGEGVGLKHSLTKLGNELFNDEFLRLRQKSNYVEPVQDFHTGLTSKVELLELEFESYQRKLEELLEKGGMDHSDFTRGFTRSLVNKNAMSDLLKLKSFAKIANPDEWFTKAKQDAMMIKAADIADELTVLGQEFYNFVVENNTVYNTYNVVLKNYGAYRVLRFLYQSMQNYLREHRLNFLSEINFRINQHLTVEDSMVIYEKIGQRIRSIMIDEFQDTSQIQWDNLSPLIQNNLAEGFPNLVVGDVKQAIYRFRNGNWEIMEIQVPAFKKKWMQPGENMVDHLPYNWRSSPEIVEFNNSFFSDLAPRMTEILVAYKDENVGEQSRGTPSEMYEELDAIAKAPKTVYGSAAQKVPELNASSTGYVEVNYWAYPKDTEPLEQESQRMEWLKNNLMELFDSGFTGDQIGILAQRKKELAILSHYMTIWSEDDPRFRYTSDDSLILDLSDGVQLLIAALKIKTGIDVDINQMVFYNYQKKMNLNSNLHEDWLAYLPHQPGWEVGNTNSDSQEGVDRLTHFFETVIGETGLSGISGQWPYLMSFLEEVKKFEMKNGANIPLFIDDWNDRIRRIQIKLSDDKDKIRMYTIHKSKGLEFDAVLMPFGEWDFETSGHETVLWVQDYQDEILKYGGPLPVNYTYDLLDSAFDYAFMGEYLRNVMDNLNLLYVAMTRPRHRLYIRLQEQEKKDRNQTDNEKKPFSSTLDLFHLKFPDLGLSNIRSGEKRPYHAPARTDDSDKRVRMKTYPVRESQLPLQLRPTFDGSQDEFIGRGLFLHGILENVKSFRDIQPAVSKAILAGDVREAERDEWIHTLRKITEYEPVRDFYLEHWNVHNEQSIMVVGGGEYRPDRVQENGKEYVIIDYKTGNPSPAHLDQIKRYQSILTKMVTLPVRSFVYYPLIPQLVEAN